MTTDDPKIPVPETPSTPQGAIDPAPPAEQEKPKDDSYKEAIVREMLTGEPAAEPPAPEPAKPPPPEQPKAEDKPTEPPPAEPAKAEPVAATDEDAEPELPDDADDRAKHAFVSLRGKYKKAKEDANFGRLVTKMGVDAGIQPEQMATWVGLAARLNRGDMTAAQELDGLLQRFRPPAPPAPAPVAPPAPVIAPEEKLYTERFKPLVDSLDITEVAARKLAKDLAAQMAPPAPAPSQPHIATHQVPQPQQQLFADPVAVEAYKEVAALEQQYKAKVPNWKDIEPAILAEIRDRYANIPPIRWLSTYEEIVRKHQASRAAPPAKAPVSTGPSLKPSAGSTTSTTNTDYKSDIVRDLMSGKL
jgi:hypothetical protein